MTQPDLVKLYRSERRCANGHAPTMYTRSLEQARASMDCFCGADLEALSVEMEIVDANSETYLVLFGGP